MRIGEYILNLAAIERNGCDRILIQLPEGLMAHACEILDEIQRLSGAVAILCQDPTYGACDIPLHLLPGTADVLVHVGHTPIQPADPRVVFVEARVSLDHLDDPFGSLAGACVRAGFTSVALTATAQYLHCLDRAMERLDSEGIRASISPGGRTGLPGQVLGCNFAAARIPGTDGVIFLGSGRFHPVGMVWATGLDVIAHDPLTGATERLGREEYERFLRRRHAAVTACSDLENFGILISTKPGQDRTDLALQLRRDAIASGRGVMLLAADLLRPELLEHYPCGAFVSTACPRLALDDAPRFGKPVLTPLEFRIVLGLEQWDHDSYGMDSL